MIQGSAMWRNKATTSPTRAVRTLQCSTRATTKRTGERQDCDEGPHQMRPPPGQKAVSLGHSKQATLSGDQKPIDMLQGTSSKRMSDDCWTPGSGQRARQGNAHHQKAHRTANHW
jgi:hypothetical protein